MLRELGIPTVADRVRLMLALKKLKIMAAQMIEDHLYDGLGDVRFFITDLVLLVFSQRQT